jgi:hypothetical protein
VDGWGGEGRSSVRPRFLAISRYSCVFCREWSSNAGQLNCQMEKLNENSIVNIYRLLLRWNSYYDSYTETSDCASKQVDIDGSSESDKYKNVLVLLKSFQKTMVPINWSVDGLGRQRCACKRVYFLKFFVTKQQ